MRYQFKSSIYFPRSTCQNAAEYLHEHAEPEALVPRVRLGPAQRHEGAVHGLSGVQGRLAVLVKRPALGDGPLLATLDLDLWDTQTRIEQDQAKKNHTFHLEIGTLLNLSSKIRQINDKKLIHNLLILVQDAVPSRRRRRRWPCLARTGPCPVRARPARWGWCRGQPAWPASAPPAGRCW